MSDITQRIADILIHHRQAGGETCGCGWFQPESDFFFEEHVAEVVTTELGLTREYQQHPEKATVIEGGCTFLPISSRYVTGWVPDE